METSTRTGLLQEAVDELRDLRRHRRREEQRLPGERQELHDPLDVGNEAHVEHAVGLVDDEDLDAGQKQAPALEVIEQAAGRGDQHVGAARDDLVLLVEGDAADQERQVELVVDAVALETVLHLAASSRVGSRIRVRGMRARARPCSSSVSIGSTKDAVLPVPVWARPSTSRRCEHVRDRLLLDRGGGGVASGLDGRDDLVA